MIRRLCITNTEINDYALELTPTGKQIPKSLVKLFKQLHYKYFYKPTWVVVKILVPFWVP